MDIRYQLHRLYRLNPMRLITILAVRWMCWRLRKDPDWYRSYQSFIAMCMYDTCKRYGIWSPGTRSGADRNRVHQMCNEGATAFMDMWIDNRRQ